MDNLNHFKYLELIEGSSAASLTLKLRAISIAYHLLQVWSDGNRHYAYINAMRPIPKGIISKISKIK